MSDKPARQEIQLPLPLHFPFTGKINGPSDFHDGYYYTNIICAAPDQFSHPSEFRVRSAKQPVPQDGGILSGLMKVSCAVRYFDLKNPTPIQIQQGKTKGHENKAFFELVD